MTNFFRKQHSWNEAYSRGEWGYLSTDRSELSRQALVASLVPIYGDPGPHSVLELGCGEGMLCRFIDNEYSYLGVDISNDAIISAKKSYPGRIFQQGDIGSHKFTQSLLSTGAAYSHIILNEVLYYLNDEEMIIFRNFLIEATKKWGDPIITASICRTDTQNLHHGSYYWSLLFDSLQHTTSIEFADRKHRWDIKSFQGLRVPPEDD